MKHRQTRINDAVAHELNEIIRGVKDPRISASFVTVNGAEVSPDLKYAKIYFGAITGDPEEIGKGLEAANGYLRTSLAKKLNLRATPELKFIHDQSAAHGAHIAEVLKELKLKD